MRTTILVLAIWFVATPAAAQSADCGSLKIIERLSRIGNLPADRLAMVAALRDAACTAASADTSRWKDRSNAKRSDGRWYYPASSVTAIDPEGRLAYPNAITALYAGRWRYPNSTVALDIRQNRRQLPSGANVTDAELIQWACKRLPARQCNAGKKDIASAAGDERELALMELAWKADQSK